MRPEIVLYIIRMILCNDEIMKWLKAESAKSTTPIDDYAVDIVYSLLCPGK